MQQDNTTHKAHKTCNKAHKTCNKTHETCNKTYNKAHKTCNKTHKTCNKTDNNTHQTCNKTCNNSFLNMENTRRFSGSWYTRMHAFRILSDDGIDSVDTHTHTHTNTHARAFLQCAAVRCTRMHAASTQTSFIKSSIYFFLFWVPKQFCCIYNVARLRWSVWGGYGQ